MKPWNVLFVCIPKALRLNLWLVEHRLFLFIRCILINCKVKQSAPLQAWSGPEGSRNLRFPDFMTTAQDSGKVVSLYPQEIHLALISVRGWVDPRAVMRPAGLNTAKFQWHHRDFLIIILSSLIPHERENVHDTQNRLGVQFHCEGQYIMGCGVAVWSA
jgi:hypothetical protein